MPPTTSGPDAISWAMAALRGLHPMRWLLSAVALTLSTLVLAGASALWMPDGSSLAAWFRAPGIQAAAFGERLAERSFFIITFRIGVLLIFFGAVCSLVGCWISRHELLSRYGSAPYANPIRIELTPTRSVVRNAKSLLVLAPLIVFLSVLLLLPAGFAGILNHIGGVGAIIVALLLPIVLIANVLVLLIGGGSICWPLMPVAIAAENGDNFDALSRGYNYAFARPLRFLFFNAVAIAIAAIPVAAVLYLVAGPIENWLASSGHPSVWIAAALSISIFWSLQSMVYLHLRTSVDNVDASELVVDEQPEPTPPAHQSKKDETTPGKTPTLKRSLLTQFCIAIVLVPATWFFTAWLMARFGGENGKWLAWGFGEQFRPETEGLYTIASYIGVFWGVLCLIAPFMVTIHRAIKGERPPSPGAAETKQTSPEGT